jgi:hypothetical protein
VGVRLRTTVFPALAAAALAVPAAAEVRVQVAGGSVDLAVTAAPVADVIDRLARQTGMKVVYEGPAPRQLVTLSLKGRTPAQAVLAVLEGQGVNFALVTDATGALVRTLLVTGSATASGGSVSTARPPASPMRGPLGAPASSPEPPVFEEEEEPTDEPPPFGVPSGVEGIDAQQQVPPEGAVHSPPAAAPAAPVMDRPIAPPQQFPVSPFAPRVTAPVPAPATPPASPATPPQQ